MVVGIVDQAIVGVNDAFGSAGLAAVGINVTLKIFPSVGFGQGAFTIGKGITADGVAGLELFYAAAFPTQLAGFGLGDEIGGQFAVFVQIAAHILGRIVLAVFIQFALGAGAGLVGGAGLSGS